MKILQINCVYKNGSTGKITYDIHTELLRNGIESVVCYGRGKKEQEECVYKTCGELYSKFNHLVSKFTGVMYGGCFFSTKKLISIIRKEQPDIVHLQCINGYFVNIYKIIDWLKKNHIRTVMTLHAEFMYTGGCGHSLDCNQWRNSYGCGYSMHCPRWRTETGSLIFDRTATMWARMKQAFDDFDQNIIIISVSPWLMKRAKLSPILYSKDHRIVLNGLDTSIFHIYKTDELKRMLGLENEKIIFYVTPGFNLNPDHIKGGYYVNELAKKFMNKNIKILVAGSYSENIIVSENLVLLGKISEQEKLAQLYSMADVTLLTSKRETFSMVTAESLCCGTPVAGFKAGAPEQIAIQKYSRFVEYGEINELERVINEVLSQSWNAEDIYNEASQRYGKDVMCKKYTEIYEELYNG